MLTRVYLYAMYLLVQCDAWVAISGVRPLVAEPSAFEASQPVCGGVVTESRFNQSHSCTTLYKRPAYHIYSHGHSNTPPYSYHNRIHTYFQCSRLYFRYSDNRIRMPENVKAWPAQLVPFGVYQAPGQPHPVAYGGRVHGRTNKRING